MTGVCKVAIVKLSAMGDIIHAMSILQFIKEARPGLQIDWFVQKPFAQVLRHNPHIDTIYELDLKAIKSDKSALFSQIKALRFYARNDYDLIIDAQGLLKSAISARLLGPNTAGFASDSIREKAAAWFYKHKIHIPYDENVIMRNAAVLGEPLGLHITKEQLRDKSSFLYYKSKPAKFHDNGLPNVLFVIGASWASKQYDPAKFSQIADTLQANCYLLHGSEQEYAEAEKIARNSRARVLPKLSIDTLKATIATADLVIGNDTGPTHMAWALNRPSITLFGNTPGYRNTFETAVNRVLESESKVDPCSLDKEDFSIQDIPVHKVLDTAHRLLEADGEQ